MNESINSSAVDKAAAIERCRHLGRRFVKYFINLTRETSLGVSFNYCCKEMQILYDEAESVVLNYTNKKLSNTQLSDWFLTCGEAVEDIITNKYIDVYEEFIAVILYKRIKNNPVVILDIAKDLFGAKNETEDIVLDSFNILVDELVNECKSHCDCSSCLYVSTCKDHKSIEYPYTALALLRNDYIRHLENIKNKERQ